MGEVVFFLEERSAQSMLTEIMTRLNPKNSSLSVRYITFEGKQDLDKNLKKRIEGYLVPDAYFIVLRDQDQASCKDIKKELIQKIPANKRAHTVVRIACHELESFYLGDLAAVERGLGIPKIGTQQNKKKLKDPDKLANAKQELRKITNSRYQPLSGSRGIARHLDLSGNNRSYSFNVLLKTLRSVISPNPHSINSHR